ncbi:MAG TPA: hypothetical protein PLF22_09210 [Pseudomonadales bacterium]|nr:hypothetical protein [Pseudomonadales bacterium]
MDIGLGLLTRVNKLLPTPMKNNPDLAWDYRVRAWGMVIVLGLSLLAPSLALLIFGGLHLLTDMDFSQAFVITLSVIFLIFFQHLYFQSYGKLEVTANAYSLQAFVSYCATIFFTGGWHSPAMPLLVCSPLIAFMTGGYRAGMTATFAVFLALCLFFIDRFNGNITNIIKPAENSDVVGLVIWLMTLTVLAVFLIVTNTLIRRHDIRSHFEKN